MDIAINHGEFDILNRLPWELWHKILRLLPVRALAVLCAVNKSFTSMIRHPDFAPFHLQYNYKPQLLNIKCYHLPDNSSFYGVPELKSFTGIVFTDQISSWYIAGSINGLLLLASNHNRVLRIVLWNPSIRKYRDIPLPLHCPQTFALGYDSSSKDHKIVATSEHEAWVYSVITNSWNALTWHSESGFRRYEFGQFGSYYDDSLSFKHGAVWTQSEYTKRNLFELVWFDFEAGKFHYSEKMAYPKARRGLLLLDGGSTVGFWGRDRQGPMTTSIWALQKDTMTWSKRYEILVEMVPFEEGFETVSFEETDGELVWKYRVPDGQGLEVSRYCLESKFLWHEPEQPFGFDGGFVTAYVESLFMLRGV